MLPIKLQKAPPPPPPPAPPPSPEVEEIFKTVERMPRFPGCENKSGGEAAKDACARAKLDKFIHQNILYPELAREMKKEGIVTVSFVIEKDGTVTNTKVEKGMGYGCDEEALRVVNLMFSQGIKWTPQGSRGRPLRILYKLDVRFDLGR